ncbi:MAG TPA: hypothetical protein DCE41_29690 [Cytophagales bacterium]|nr:hypothetical protein [Cytophagales bacterium]HAA23854.1 hypothetical protein [Cytophagales bacterium]HAP59933.1 hypothetical protein [Cytophagales bacterium]
MFKYDVKLNSSSGHLVLGKGILILEEGKYSLSFSEGNLEGAEAKGTYETKIEYGVLTSRLEGASGSKGTLRPAMLVERSEGLLGLTEFIYKEIIYHGLLEGKLVNKNTPTNSPKVGV